MDDMNRWDEHENQSGRVDHAEKDEMSTHAVIVKPVNILFGSTGYGPLWKPACESWLRAINLTARELAASKQGKIGGIGVTDRTYTATAQNTLVEDFLADEEATHLFMTEMDMILPDDTILKLLALDKDIAAGLYFLRGGDGQPCLYQKVLTPRDHPYPMSPVRLFPTDRPFKADCPGLGCVLFKRSVFETLTFPWFEVKSGDRGHGSDLYFFTHVRDAGIEVWVSPNVRCGQIDYCTVSFADYEAKIAKDPKWRTTGVILGGLE